MVAISKNVYKSKLPELVKEYKNIIQGTIKIKTADSKPETSIDFVYNITQSTPSLRFVILYESQSIKYVFKRLHILVRKSICD